jgi:hypothetical protein
VSLTVAGFETKINVQARDRFGNLQNEVGLHVESS